MKIETVDGMPKRTKGRAQSVDVAEHVAGIAIGQAAKIEGLSLRNVNQIRMYSQRLLRQRGISTKTVTKPAEDGTYTLFILRLS